MLGAPARARLLAQALDRTDGAPGRDALVDALARCSIACRSSCWGRSPTRSPRATARDADAVARVLAEASGREVAPRSAEAWRRLALAAERAGDADAKREFAARYARDCVFIHAPAMPVLWPRRTAGDALRVAVLVGPRDRRAHARRAVARWPRPDIEVDARRARVAGARPRRSRPRCRSCRRRSSVSAPQPDPATARMMLVRDPDVLLDAAGLAADAGPWIAQRAGRTRRVARRSRAAARRRARRAGRRGARGDARPRSHGRRRPAPSADARCPSSFSAGLRAAAGRRCATRRRRGLRRRCSPSSRRSRPRCSSARGSHGTRRSSSRRAATSRRRSPPRPATRRSSSTRAGSRSSATSRRCAVALVRKGLERIPAHPRLTAALGHALLKLGDGAAAVEAFQHAMALDPLNAELHYNLGVAHQLAGNQDAAARSYQHALAFDPGAGRRRLQPRRPVPAGEPPRRRARGVPARARARPDARRRVEEPGRDPLRDRRACDEWAASHRRFERTARTRCCSPCRRSSSTSSTADFAGGRARARRPAARALPRRRRRHARRRARGAPVPAAVLRRRAGDGASLRADLRRGREARLRRAAPPPRGAHARPAPRSATCRPTCATT